MTRVLMLASDDRVIGLVKNLPGHQVAIADGEMVDRLLPMDGLQGLLGSVAGDAPDVVIIGTRASTDGLTLAESIARSHPHVDRVMIAEPAPDLVYRAMRAGVREILTPDVSQDDLKVLLHRSEAKAGRRAAASQTPEGAPKVDADRHRVVVVTGAKGGVGRSTIASNLAVSLAREAPMETVLVDLDLFFPDLATVLDLAPLYSIADALDTSSAFDSLILKTFLTVHQSGFYVLCGSPSPALVDKVSQAQIKRLLTTLSAQFRYVIVDTAARLDEFALSAVEEATDVVLVSSMDRASSRSLQQQIALLNHRGILPSSRHVVLNFADRRSGLGVRDVEVAIGLPVDVVIARSPEVSSAGNRGELLGSRRKATAAAKAVNALADLIRKEEESDFVNKHRGVAIA